MPATIDLPGNAGVSSQSVADQVINAATTALLTGSKMQVPAGKLRIGTTFRWGIAVSKTAAGTAANSFLVKIGALGTASDPTVITLALPVGTAVADNAWIDIVVTVQGPLSGVCIAKASLVLTHNLSATGFATTPNVVLVATSATFDATVADLFVSLACTTAASTVLTFTHVLAEGWNL